MINPLMTITVPLNAKGELRLGKRPELKGRQGQEVVHGKVSYTNAARLVLDSMGKGLFPIPQVVASPDGPVLIVNFFTPDQAQMMVNMQRQADTETMQPQWGERLPVGTKVECLSELIILDENAINEVRIEPGEVGTILHNDNGDDQPYTVLWGYLVDGAEIVNDVSADEIRPITATETDRCPECNERLTVNGRCVYCEDVEFSDDTTDHMGPFALGIDPYTGEYTGS